MIEVQKARSGDEFYIFNGKPLASRNDPKIEAEKWCDSHAKRVRGCKSVIILGAGSGFHLHELIKRYPNLPIYVLEPRADLVDRVRSRWGLSLSQIQFVFKVEEIPDRSIATSFITLRHMPSWAGEESWFTQAEEYLSARVGVGFSRQKQLRPAFANARLIKMADFAPLSIHHLLTDAHVRNLAPIDAASLLLLGELIK